MSNIRHYPLRHRLISRGLRYTGSMRILRVLALFVVAGGLPGALHAAQIYIDLESSSYSRADTFYAPVRIDTQGECINAVSVVVAYDPEVLHVQDVSLGDSIITLWTEQPTIDRENGRVSFSGGVPGGFCGRLMGDPGLTNTLVKLVVTGAPQAREVTLGATTSLIIEPGTSVFLHDGAGGVAPLTVLGAEVHMVSTTTTPVNAWLGDVGTDSTAPELFEVTLVKGPSPGNKLHYITFNTTDKQSGIDHYEVLETDPDKFGFLTWVPREAYWVPANSPSYVLRDQKLRSKIMVKAVDKNGNERVVTYTPPMSPLATFTRASFLIPLAIIIVVLGALTVLAVRLMRVRRRLEAHTDADSDTTEHEHEEN